MEALATFAELEGILLDPVHSAKGAAQLIDLIRKGHFKRGERIVFLQRVRRRCSATTPYLISPGVA